MIKLVAIDLDGTLLNDAKKVSRKNKDVLQRAEQRGIHIVICTGRPLFAMDFIYQEIGLKNGYVIVNNGCSTHRTDNWELVSWHQLTKNDMLRLNQVSKPNEVDLTLFDEKHYFCVSAQPNQEVQKDAEYVLSSVTPITIEEAISGKYTMFQAMYVGEPRAIDELEKMLPASIFSDYSTVRSQPKLFEVLPKAANKATGIETLAKQLGISRTEIMAIGDGNNDIEMLEYAQIGVAMGNATEQVKAITPYRTATNNEDGVALAIEKYCFEN